MVELKLANIDGASGLLCHEALPCRSRIIIEASAAAEDAISSKARSSSNPDQNRGG
ncbi:hypothetical protein Arad_1759 [Rhizobium rhizogenes K84]|uniref:Uncharacterized protein n=1 Tax=Rhizobium rhizogenes (strain K84 / ATCC BAA-868) TaxID=311403 RepID=B9JCY1_RHIR8|nr:hypothetical protein Arad_1759 [Rhizobium rhizogenes K84]